MDDLTIGELGKEVGLPPKTIRFYEEAGLLAQPKRRENGYRVYDRKTAETLRVVKRARDLGLPLNEIKKLMLGCRGGCTHSREYLENEIDSYTRLLEEKINQLVNLKEKLLLMRSNLTSMARTGAGKAGYRCDILRPDQDPRKEVK